MFKDWSFGVKRLQNLITNIEIPKVFEDQVSCERETDGIFFRQYVHVLQ